MDVGHRVVMAHDALDGLLTALRQRGYRLVGPTLSQDAIVSDGIESAADLPVGWTDEQAPGSYRLRAREDDAVFGFASTPQSFKRFLFPPRSPLWQDEPSAGETAPYAFIGVRSCDLHAIAIQDRVFMGSTYVDPTYAAARKGAFIVAVDCSQAGATCFCASMGTGPRADAGFDLALTELIVDGRHDFLVRIGSRAGGEVMAEVPHRAADDADVAAAAAVVARTAASMGRSMDTTGIKELLYGNLEHPRWDDVAARCLSCTNCTLVCPTCFCFSIETVGELSDGSAGRERSWDSCFALEHSYIHGGSVRGSNRARYRQWMTHKLATWIDQFGTSGCVGCGRCITWCPVGIDITQEVAAIRASPGATTRKEASGAVA